MGKTIIEKIWDLHVVEAQEGFPDLVAIDLMLIHEVTSAQAFQMIERTQVPVFDPRRLVATLDHSIPTRSNRFLIHDETARTQVDALRKNVAKHNITLFDFDSSRQGIVHVIGPELGLVHPGMTVVCGDSHTSTHGAFGAIAFGIGSTEVGHVLGTSALLMERPDTMKVVFIGEMAPLVCAKDVILKLISVIGVGGANRHIIEYTGTAIRAMTMEERMTICNMSIECGARAGLIAPDETTFAYLKDRPSAPKEFNEAVSFWKTLLSDPDAIFDKTVTVDLDTLTPMVTWGTNPAQAAPVSERIPHPDQLPPGEATMAQRALDYHGLTAGMRLQDVPVDFAFLGSCTNGRIQDLRIAATLLRGRRIHERVTFYVVPGSEAVRDQAVKEGLDKIFEEAGADFRMPGCSMCLGMNDDQVPAGKRCISSSNRNFVGRQGRGSFTHLASPATVAASAVAGRIAHPGEFCYGER